MSRPWPERALARQLAWKAESAQLPEAARVRGHAWIEKRGRRVMVGPSPKMLPLTHAAHNLLPGVRAEAIARFARHDIAWHMETPGPDGCRLPSTHVLDSQVQCVNVLLSLAQHPPALLDLVRQVLPEARTLVPIEDDSPVAFEWIGARNYLGERHGRLRARGRFATSLDALAVAELSDSSRTGILMEWKFTERYHRPVPAISGRGTDRRAIYRPAYRASISPFAQKPPIDAYLHEPHYQLLRQALLGAAMVQAGEFGIDRAVLLHLVPSVHYGLKTLVPEGLQPFGGTVAELWSALLPGPVLRYLCVDTLPLLGATPDLRERYGELA